MEGNKKNQVRKKRTSITYAVSREKKSQKKGPIFKKMHLY